jgi:hypothetical protein
MKKSRFSEADDEDPARGQSRSGGSSSVFLAQPNAAPFVALFDPPDRLSHE